VSLSGYILVERPEKLLGDSLDHQIVVGRAALRFFASNLQALHAAQGFKYLSLLAGSHDQLLLGAIPKRTMSY